MLSVPDTNMSNAIACMLSHLKAILGFPFWIFFLGGGGEERGRGCPPPPLHSSRQRKASPKSWHGHEIPGSCLLPTPHNFPPRDGTPCPVPHQDDAQGSPRPTCSTLQRKASMKSWGASKSRVALCSTTFLAKNSSKELFWKKVWWGPGRRFIRLGRMVQSCQERARWHGASEAAWCWRGGIDAGEATRCWQGGTVPVSWHGVGKARARGPPQKNLLPAQQWSSPSGNFRQGARGRGGTLHRCS